MPRSLIMAFAVGLALGWPAPLWSQTATPPLPSWQDSGSVYLKAARPVESRTAEYASPTSLVPAQTADSAVAPAGYDEPFSQSAAPPAPEPPPSTTTANDDRRRLPPPSSAPARGGERLSSPRQLLPGLGLPTDSLYTMFTGLALVVGLFLLCAWALRRGVRTPSTVLPGEVVSVIGRVPLAARQFAQLLRVGNKLVLVSVTPSGAETLAEVTDPAEVDRLLGICQQHNPKSSTREFEQVFKQLAEQGAADAFIERDAPAEESRYARLRGGAARG